MIFYTSGIAAFGANVAIVSAAKGIECDRRNPPGGEGSDEYESIKPTGTSPALVDGKFVISESEIIADSQLPQCRPVSSWRPWEGSQSRSAHSPNSATHWSGIPPSKAR